MKAPTPGLFCLSLLLCRTMVVHALLLTRIARSFSVVRCSLGTIRWTRRHQNLSMASSSSNAERRNVGEGTRTLSPGLHVSETMVKKSRFVAYARHVATWEEAQACIEDIRSEHPKARHWCYGFRCGFDPVSERCSDDGEPTGTAGTPILGRSLLVSC